MITCVVALMPSLQELLCLRRQRGLHRAGVPVLGDGAEAPDTLLVHLPFQGDRFIGVGIIMLSEIVVS